MRSIAMMLLLLGSTASAADKAPRYARLTVLEPKPGKVQEFEDGYRRHLDWHREHKDPWTWYGWTIATGERTGTFIDGTFERTGAELDAPVAPTEDRADNAKNVYPHAQLASTALYRFRPDLSRGPTSQLEAPQANLATIEVRPGHEKAFEAALRRLGSHQRIVYELVTGGARPTYVVFVPASKTSELLSRPAVPVSDAIASARVEALRFRSDLTYLASGKN